ncbi:MAG: LuxR C-terminal-related transcriptional regulator [Chitinophagales bacterium]
MSAIKVIIADAQYLARAGLSHLLSQQVGIDVVSEADNNKDLVIMTAAHQPDVIILDYNSKFLTVEASLKIAQVAPNTKILVISADNDKSNILNAVRSGVNGYLTKNCSADEIINALQATAKGDKFFCNSVLNILIEPEEPEEETKKRKIDCEPTNLSSREIEIVQHISEGFSAKEIAKALFISPHTVYTHRKNIMKKVGVNSASELIVFAMKTGII